MTQFFFFFAGGGGGRRGPGTKKGVSLSRNKIYTGRWEGERTVFFMGNSLMVNFWGGGRERGAFVCFKLRNLSQESHLSLSLSLF